MLIVVAGAVLATNAALYFYWSLRSVPRHSLSH
jgi:hypothetical protein